MDARSEFQRVIDQYLAAYEAHDSAGCAALYGEDAIILSPFGPPAIGREAIRAAHRAWFDEDETGKTMTVLRASIEGDTGHCLVAYAADVPGDAGPQRAHGASLNTLSRVDGRWRLTHTSLNELENDIAGHLP